MEKTELRLHDTDPQQFVAENDVVCGLVHLSVARAPLAILEKLRTRRRLDDAIVGDALPIEPS